MDAIVLFGFILTIVILLGIPILEWWEERERKGK